MRFYIFCFSTTSDPSITLYCSYTATAVKVFAKVNDVSVPSPRLREHREQATQG
jgi:hypothetical protein